MNVEPAHRRRRAETTQSPEGMAIEERQETIVGKHNPDGFDEPPRMRRDAERIRMNISSKDFRVREGDDVDLKKWPTKVIPAYKWKGQYQRLLREHVAQLSSQQQLLYASNRYAVLLIFQAM